MIQHQAYSMDCSIVFLPRISAVEQFRQHWRLVVFPQNFTAVVACHVFLLLFEVFFGVAEVSPYFLNISPLKYNAHRDTTERGSDITVLR